MYENWNKNKIRQCLGSENMYGLYFLYLPEFFKIHSVIMLFYELEKKSLFYKYGDDTYLGYNDSVCDTH